MYFSVETWNLRDSNRALINLFRECFSRLNDSLVTNFTHFTKPERDRVLEDDIDTSSHDIPSTLRWKLSYSTSQARFFSAVL